MHPASKFHGSIAALGERGADMTQPIKIAILAMGGEGGGVLADWIVGLGEANGFIAQTTSVPGVAQRTGRRSTTWNCYHAPPPKPTAPRPCSR